MSLCYSSVFSSLLIIWCNLNGTPYKIDTAVTPQGTIIHFISEHHELNDNSTIIDAFFSLVSKGNGYRLFVERGDFALSKNDHPLSRDLLGAVFLRSNELNRSTLYDIETRKTTRTARYLLTRELKELEEIAALFQSTTESSLTAESLQFKKHLEKTFGNDLAFITFQDVIDELTNLLEWQKEIHGKRSWKDYFHLQTISKSLVGLRMLLDEHNIIPSEGILTFALITRRNFECFQEALSISGRFVSIEVLTKQRKGYSFLREHLPWLIWKLSWDVFDLILNDKIMEIWASPLDTPVIVIAGGEHINVIVENLKKYCGAVVCTTVAETISTAESKPKHSVTKKQLSALPHERFELKYFDELPLEPQHLALLEQPASYFQFFPRGDNSFSLKKALSPILSF